MVLFNIWVLIQIIIGCNLILSILLLLIYNICRLFPKLQKSYKETEETDYAIIVTAYEDVTLIPAVVKSILNINYSNYLIYVVADNCNVTELSFDDNRVIVLEPKEILASNIKSHFHAIENFRRRHQRLTIIDSDNLVHSDYLIKIEEEFSKGFSAVQGLRKPKNLETSYARLDAARDLYYHFYDGKVLFEVGSSATLSGSAMAFDTDLYKQCLEDENIQGAGFDKVLQYKIVKRGLRIAFTEDAIVYDAKTSGTKQLVLQRTRWIQTWFKYFAYGFRLSFSGLIKLNWNQFLFGIVLLRPPLFIFLTLCVLSILINFWIYPSLAIAMLLALFCFVSGFFIPLMRRDIDKRIYYSLLNIPKFVFLQFLSLSRIRRTKEMPLTTKHHNAVNLEEIK